MDVGSQPCLCWEATRMRRVARPRFMREWCEVRTQNDKRWRRPCLEKIYSDFGLAEN